MTNLILYSVEMSPPCRAVLMTAEAIGVKLDVRSVNLPNKEHLTDEFIKMNPQHTIPTLNDNGFILWDSHAIMCYLVSKYSDDDALYPKDPQKRAIVDQRLHFESGILFSIGKRIFKPILTSEETKIPPEKLMELEQAYQFLESFLKGKKWLAGDSYTLADISCASTVSSLEFIKPLDNQPNVKAWLKRCEEQLPAYQKYAVPGLNQLRAVLREKSL